ncbi:DUF1593-domain-containing protein [Thozetella sp. PMI_491]|nr:DUF1593-domain-containing protein [Thozetella sp. PMI_491]
MADLSQLQTFASRPRIFILTDMLNEPDDSQSLIRYLLYANEFETRGICATTSTWLRDSNHPEEIRRILAAYDKVVDNLNKHVHPEFSYKPADHFLPLVTAGPTVYGKKAFSQPISEGAQRLIDALKESEEPLYVPVWGGVNTAAQALLHMEKDLSADEFAKQRAKLWIYTISDQDDTGAWIRAKFPDVHFIISVHGWGEYHQASWLGINAFSGDGPDPTKTLDPWLDEHIRVGELGAAYPPTAFGMEGDTPSFLWLVQNGLGQRDHIEWGGWGGRYSRAQAAADAEYGYDSNLFVNTSERDVIGADGKKYGNHQATIWRWRDAIQDDFAARMQWALTSDFAAAAHPPVVAINGEKGPEPIVLKVKAGETHVLDASATFDPDSASAKTGLEFAWYLYGSVNNFNFYQLIYKERQAVRIEALAAPATPPAVANNTAGFADVAHGPKVQVTVPEVIVNNQTHLPTPDFHIILQVTNNAGKYPIRRYKRAIFEYS